MPPIVLLVVVLFVTAILVAAGVVSLLAWSILHPPRMTDGKAAWVLKRVSPGDLGMTYQEVSFDVRDGRSGELVRIRGWWIPSKTPGCDRCVVMAHGYADAKVGTIAWAPTWQTLGFNILAIDLRAHGESGGTQCTGGYFEREDLRQVIQQLQARHPAETRGGIALFGVSLGSLVAAAAASGGGETPLELLAVVLDSPITSFRAGVEQHVRRLGIAGWGSTALAVKLAEKVSGADFSALQLPALLAGIAAPVMLIWGEEDGFVPPETREQLLAAFKARANPGDSARAVPNAGHLMEVAADPAAYAAALSAFLGSSKVFNSLTASD